MFQVLLFFLWITLSSCVIFWGIGVSKSISSEQYSTHLASNFHTIGGGGAEGTGNMGFDPEYPFNNVVNSFFPVDALVEYQSSHNVTNQIISRYASFSNVLEIPITSYYEFFPYDGCSITNSTEFDREMYDKILILKRGDCTFVDKVRNVVESNLNPRAIIVGNDEPMSGLITMYSGTFNQDGAIKLPILFITHEDYEELHDLPSGIQITISTASFGSWINLVLSMALSPPLLILSFYSLIKICQKCRRKQKSRNNVKLVNSLPVYIYNINHLIPTTKFKEYLKMTNQVEPKENIHTPASGGVGLDESLSTSTTSCTSSCLSLSNGDFIVNGIDIRSSASILKLLLSPNDFYQTYKCSICLDHFKPLQSKILVLDCKHFYHQNCLSNWLINFKKSCPLCNKLFKSNQGLLEDEHANFGTFDLELQIESESEGEGEVEHEHEHGNGNDHQDEIHDNNLEIGDNSAEMAEDQDQEQEQDLVLEPFTFSPNLASTSISLTADNFSFYSARDQFSQRNHEIGSSVEEEFLTPISGSLLSTENDDGSDNYDQTLNDDTPSIRSEITIDGYASPLPITER